MTKILQVEKAVMDDQPAAEVMVEALVPMWGDNDVVPLGTRYRLPADIAKYLADLGFVAVVTEAG